MPNKHINYEQDSKIKVQFEKVGGDNNLLILIDPDIKLEEVMDKLVEAKFFPNGDYSSYSFLNKRTNSFLSGSTLKNSGVRDGDRVRIFPPLAAG